MIEREISFWRLSRDKAANVFLHLDDRFRVMAWTGHFTFDAPKSRAVLFHFKRLMP